MRILLLVALLLAPSITWAHLEASLEECEAKYGATQGGQDGTYVFFVGELVYVCEFNQANGRCKAMTVATKIKLPLTNAEVAAILKDNPGEGEWTPEGGSTSRWKHSAGKWVAAVVNGNLVIQREFR